MLRSAAVTFAAVAWMAMALPAVAQNDTAGRPPPPLFRAPAGAMTFNSPMLLLEGGWQDDLRLIRSRGVTAEPALPGLGDRALQIGSMLVLKIDGNRTLRIFDLPDLTGELGPSIHRFQAWLPQPRLYAVSVTCNECAKSVYLIDARDGSVAFVQGVPKLSPSGQYGLLWHGHNSLGGVFWPALLDFRSRPFSYFGIPDAPDCARGHQAARPAGHWPSMEVRPSATWLDDSHIAFEGKLGLPGPPDPGGRQILRLVDDRAEWQC